MIACLCWVILFVFVVAFMCCIMPWWIVLLVMVVGVVSSLINWNQPYVNRSKSKRSRKQKKGRNTDYKTSNNMGTTTFRGGVSSSPHQLNNNIDYERYRAYREEQAAYDDFIASLDMDD